MEIEEKEGLQRIIPDAGGTFSALRDMGYDNISAIADLMDNSIDAEATEIRLTIGESDKIIIADNGTGMPYNVLCKAIQIGGKKSHESVNDLGKYGLGLITASLSMSPRIKIITSFNGIFHTAILDYEVIAKSNDFLVEIRKSTPAEEQNFGIRTHNATSGTVVVLDKCDKIEYRSVDAFARRVADVVPQIFRYYIRDGKNIYINNTRLNYIDPLFLNQSGTIRRVDKDIEIRTLTGLEKMHILAVTIPDQGRAMNTKLRINQSTQGFYIMRNNREIAAGFEIPEVFGKHNDYNLLRIELHFDSCLDDMMGINIKKHDIVPNQVIINDLKEALADTVSIVRKEAKDKQKRKKDDNPFKQGGANTGATGGGVEGVSAGSDTGAVSPFGTPAQPTAITQPTVTKSMKCKFNTRFKTPDDSLFEVSFSNDTINIWYNGANAYYANKIIGGDGGLGLKKDIDHIVGSLAQSCVECGITPVMTQRVLELAARKIEEESKDDGESSN